MLYDRWRQIVQTFARETALYDLSSGRRWTFEEVLAAETSVAVESEVAFPQGLSVQFVLTVLGAWRAGRTVCPLEVGQPPISFSALPPNCVHVKTTSASTGVARCVAFTARQLSADSENIVATMGLRRDWPNLAVISLAHSYGFSNLVLPLLLHGIPLILGDSSLPETVRRAASLSQITLPAVPALWRAWHEADAIPENVRLAISAGAPLSLPLETDIFQKRGLKIHNFYGSTECGGIAYDETLTPRDDTACVGAPMRDVELSLNEQGCLQVHSKAVGETYWPASDPKLSGGCFQTSDLAELTGGRVYLRGRLSDQINVAGRKVSPDVIERILATHPEIRECLVFGVPCEHSGRSETIVACVALRSHGTTEGLRQFLLSKLPSWQVPRAWWLIDNLENNQRGKLSRAEWREKYLREKINSKA